MTAVSLVSELIRERIRRDGRVPFNVFMDLALYSRDGYYQDSQFLGSNRDYYTSPKVHPIFGMLMAIQLWVLWCHLGKISKFPIIEQGGGDGHWAEDILSFASIVSPEFGEALEYVLIDRHIVIDTPNNLNHLIANNIPLLGQNGVVISNELLDAFPSKLFEIRNGRPLEVYVGLNKEDQFVEILDIPETIVLERALSEINVMELEGYRGGYNTGLDSWVNNVSDALKSGFVITIDYGYDREVYYSMNKSNRLFQTYYKHVDGGSPYERVGDQDMTAHINFGELIDLGRLGGLSPIYYGTQADWLMRLGFRDLYNSYIDRLPEYKTRTVRSRALIDSNGLGGFKVLIQEKDTELKNECLLFYKDLRFSDWDLLPLDSRYLV